MNKEILRLAIPNILSNISVPLLSTVDTALMGRLSAAHIAAVGIGGMIFNFIYWNFGFLRMGTTGMTAQAYGAEDVTRQANILVQSTLVGLILAVLFLIFSEPLISSASYLMNIDGEHVGLVRSYFMIRVWDAPATMLLYGVMGWLFGMQNSIYPLVLTIVINLFNIAVSYTLVVVYQMDIVGVAWGTVLSQYLGVIVAIILIFIKYRAILAQGEGVFAQYMSELKKYLTINGDIFLRTLCLTLAFGIFYSQSAKLGSGILAANVVLLLFVNWMSYAIDGFAYATESIVGKYKGKGEGGHLRDSIKLLFQWAAGSAVLITLFYWLTADQLTMLFSNQADVINEVGEYHIWVIIFPLAAFVCYIWDGVFIGLTAVHAMRNAMLLAFALYLPTLYFGTHYWGNHGLWAALLLFMIYRGAIQTWLFQKKGMHLK